MVLLIDNYDSFVHNLARYLRRLGADTRVVRSDALTAAEAAALGAAAIVLSPGPGRPERAGCCIELVRRVWGRTPLLGVCLGHQAIAAALGARVVRAARPVHGQASWIWHDGRGVFRGAPQPMAAGRYHSLVVDPASLPPSLVVSAWSEGGEVMALRGVGAPAVGLQFHPESVLTPHGFGVLARFLELAGAARRASGPAPAEAFAGEFGLPAPPPAAARPDGSRAAAGVP